MYLALTLPEAPSHGLSDKENVKGTPGNPGSPPIEHSTKLNPQPFKTSISLAAPASLAMLQEIGVKDYINRHGG